MAEIVPPPAPILVVNPKEDPNHPFFLHHNDTTNTIVIKPPSLTGPNYLTWNKAFSLALSIKNKLGFVDGSISTPAATDPLYASWLRCSNTVSVYFTQLNALWEELKNYRPLPYCSCGLCTRNALRSFSGVQSCNYVFKFLMGLNDSFEGIRGQILLLSPTPSLDKVFSMVLQDERQREARLPSPSPIDSLSFAINHVPDKKKWRPNLFNGPRHSAHATPAPDSQPSSNTEQQTGISLSFPSALIDIPWIVDTGAIDHMVCSPDFFTSPPSPYNSRVNLPNGDKVQVTSKGTIQLTPTIQLADVLYIPSFHFNLISISKLTKHSSSCVTILNNVCYL
ncbi:hypothetical protein DH2020_034572 [Rehmannia glutinosa]|uniref:Retrotransposon Copia-like N-terminal domain-containing protein n=1 Tax=Rehmannia glutinosa TaxID=99300 RepID=A0ABR0VCM6_REHGL